jgi:hypothetical protein
MVGNIWQPSIRWFVPANQKRKPFNSNVADYLLIIANLCLLVAASDNSIRNMEEERTELRQGRTATGSKATTVLKMRQTNVSAGGTDADRHRVIAGDAWIC